ncbi:isochorismatase [Thalassobacillus hwangdonensis]|uniref:Isochorismatase n=1 Tax=Thalassobacillus hwangdonensis TaxID=546108 RepID=A0ABW3L0D0_9BACI
MIKIQSDYQKRPIRFLQLWENGGWSLKVYGISYSSEYPSNKLMDKAKELARDILPFPAVTKNRYGLGFIGVHEGSGANFIFIDWWSNENELNHHVYVESHGDPGMFKYVTPKGLIACCWDLKVLSYERDCWVESVLNNSTGSPDIDLYLNMHLNEDV